MFMMLVRKDFRLQLPVLIAAGLLFLAPAAIYLIAHAVTADSTSQQEPEPLVWVLIAMTGIGVAVASLTVPAFAGVAAARERRERSAEFLEAMPIARWMIVASRGLVAIMCSLLPVVVGAVCLTLLGWLDAIQRGAPYQHSGSPFPSDVFEVAFVGAATVTAAAGVAWFVGSLIRSEVIAAALGLAIPIAVHTATYIVIHRLSGDTFYRLGIDRDGPWGYTLSQFAVAIPCLIVGTVIALQRRSP